jgi:toxin HigB-1
MWKTNALYCYVANLGIYEELHFIWSDLMIRSFADSETEKIWNFQRSRKLPQDIQRPALRKLIQLDSIEELQELRQPPGNRFEQLKGYTVLRYSIRINGQWRITFNWLDGAADDVKIEDHH